VVDYLVAAGVEPARLTAVGFGESRPVASNDTTDGRAQNRRIDFVVEGEAG
jgi:OOP family OmpA-OmpF porin